MSRASAIAHLVAQRPLTSPHYEVRHIVMSRVRTGASLLQTPGAIQAEMQKIDDDITAFAKELHDHILSLPGFPNNPPTAIEHFYESVWSPYEQAWEAWYKNHHSWLGNLWWNHAPTAEEYLKQLVELRQRARDLGMEIQSAEPSAPTLGVVDSIMAAIMTMLKTLLIVALGVGAILLIISWAR